MAGIGLLLSLVLPLSLNRSLFLLIDFAAEFRVEAFSCATVHQERIESMARIIEGTSDVIRRALFDPLSWAISVQK
ncbi:MAG: hypothetical protein ACJ8AJ_09720 [Gemmatimonadaceae bacterium]